MNRKLIVAIECIFIILLSCNHSPQENRIREFYPNGDLKREYDSTATGEYTGNYIEYYHNGAIKVQASFLDGYYVGSYKYYYENGKLNVASDFILMYKEKRYIPTLLRDSIDIDKKICNQNTRFYYDAEGNIVKDSSFYYSVEALYKKNEEHKLKEKIIQKEELRLLFTYPGDTIGFKIILDVPYFNNKEHDIEYQWAFANSEDAPMLIQKNSTVEIPFAQYLFIPKEKGIGYFYGVILETNSTLNENKYTYVELKYIVK